MKVFVTGSTGLLGSNLIDELLFHGHQVKALVRSPDQRKLLKPGVQPVHGDLRVVRGFEYQLAQMDILIHAAACYGEYYRTSKQTLPQEINVKGTLALLNAALRQKTKNIIYISSAAVLEPQQVTQTDENSPYDERTKDPYFKSKVDAEKAVYSFMEANPGLRIVFILPTVMLGPGDRGPTPTGNFILKLLNGKIKFVLPGWHRIVDARDVAKGVVEAMSKGKNGERYLIGGRRYSVAKIYQTLSEVSGKPMPTKHIPPKKLLVAAHLMHLVSKVTGRTPPIKPSIVKQLQKDFWYSSLKAEQQLRVHFRQLTETMADMVNWFQSEKLA